MKIKTSVRAMCSILCITCLALAGCDTTSSTPPTSATEAGTASSAPSPSETTSPQQATTTDYIGVENAEAIAFEHANLLESDVLFLISELEHDDGRAIYEVDFWDGNLKYNYDIDALTGEIVGFSQEEESNVPTSDILSFRQDGDSTDPSLSQSGTNAPTPATSSTDYITVEQAKEIALQNAGVNASDAQNLQCEFDMDDGRAEYEVDWNVGATEYEYTLNAIDGTILEYDVE